MWDESNTLRVHCRWSTSAAQPGLHGANVLYRGYGALVVLSVFVLSFLYPFSSFYLHVQTQVGVS